MAKFLLIDNRDSFTYNLKAWVMQGGYECQVLSCDDPMARVREEHWDLAILGPGPGTPQEAGWLLDFISLYGDSKPMLGICLGHQALGIHFGSKLVNAQGPVFGKKSLLRLSATMEALMSKSGWPSTPKARGLEVMRYHSLILDQVPLEFELLAIADDDCSTQAMRHQSKPLWGYQFHPESVLSDQPELLLKIFMDSIK